MRRAIAMAAWLGWACSAAAGRVAIAAPALQARLEGGRLTALADVDGNAYIGPTLTPAPAAIVHREDGTHPLRPADPDDALSTADRAHIVYAPVESLPGSAAHADVTWDHPDGGLGISLACRAPQRGIAGIEWQLGPIPSRMAILVPGYGGMKMTADAATTRVSLEYPMFWEAQLVIVEEPDGDRGFCVWADDPEGRYKRLTVDLRPDGWWLGFTTWNNAPFADHDACRSVTWRVNVYRGDWRVPARAYRAWARSHLPDIANKQPSWVKDIRTVAILFDGPDIKTVDMLAGQVDPRQALLYVPDWRPEGYDRLYPTYRPVARFGAFVERAHALGFRVMPHVNYFGCDPDHPLYPRFKPYHVRDAWGTHDPRWFVWDDAANPVNNRRLAYINPALKSWRELVVEAIRRLHDTAGIDAVYLDQTLNIYNDYNGLIDGATMLQGNLALGEEIRAALPDLAIGGEGLNDVSARYQVFCQRHAWGIDFARGTWNKAQLALAHPLSAYLFQPAHSFNYLGVPSPDRAQYYAAWRENLTRWGALPTLMLYDSAPIPRRGFPRQILDEIGFWQGRRLDPDPDGAWPADVVFPYRTADGHRAERRTDGSLRCEGRQISRTVTGVSQISLPGLIEGAFCFDDTGIFGLNPALWYPYFDDPRDADAFHVAAIPAGVTLQHATRFDGLAILAAAPTVVANLAGMMGQATTGSRPFDGNEATVQGPLNGEDGSQFAAAGDRIHAHPPWKFGTGTAFARWSVDLPAGGAPAFAAGVALDSGAVGKADALDTAGVGVSDGVRFAVTARRGGRILRQEVFNATADPYPLELDLTPFAGASITLELEVHPGPQGNVTADWARWHDPRITEGTAVTGQLVVVDPEKQTTVLTGTRALTPSYTGNRGTVDVSFPGTVVLLQGPPTPVGTLPCLLAEIPFRRGFADVYGQVLTAPAWAEAERGIGSVGGVDRDGLRVHPPDRGRTMVAYALSLPAAPARFRTVVGLQDGSSSTGIAALVQVNGIELCRRDIRGGEPWCDLEADLSPWAGKPIVLSLVTDSAGPFSGDWCRWGEPRLDPQ